MFDEFLKADSVDTPQKSNSNVSSPYVNTKQQTIVEVTLLLEPNKPITTNMTNEEVCDQYTEEELQQLKILGIKIFNAYGMKSFLQGLTTPKVGHPARLFYPNVVRN